VVEQKGTIGGIEEIPEEDRAVFVTAHDIIPRVAPAHAGGISKTYGQCGL